MSFIPTLILGLLLLILALAAYVDRVYFEMGKFLAREYQDNIDSWEQKVEPRLRLGRESIAQSASVLRQLSLAGVALVAGLRLYAPAVVGHAQLAERPGWAEIARAIFELVLLILIFDRLIPQVLFVRTRGLWVMKIRYLLQALFFVILPVTLLLGLLLSIVALAEPEDTQEEEHPSEAMDALLEAGEEEGILEESDRELVRSVVEFGDKVVREVMTPRPEIFAVPDSLTLKEFTAEIQEHVFSRVPVFRASLDHITGIAFAHDLLQVSDDDAETLTIAQMQRPAAFVPETKMVAELLREMQSEKQHMRIVIDEYGAVAGIVTIEDLLEAIVGNIADEHDEPEDDDTPIRERGGAYVVSGAFELSRLRDLFADQFPVPGKTPEPPDADDPTALRLAEHYESTTVGGLVSELAGHIPLPGEVVEEDGLRLEVLASTDRRIDSIRVSLAE
jgi:putative hemolysin